MKLPRTLGFRDFWLALFCILLVICNMMIGPEPRSVGLVHALFSAVDSMRKSDFLTATIVIISPTSPKPKGDSVGEEGGAHPADGSPVPVSVAQRGLGSAGSVPIPLDIWSSLVHGDSLKAMASVQIPQPRLAPAVGAMMSALVQQKHIVPISAGMPGFGLSPSAPIFVIPKSAEKCSLIVNCKAGNRKDPQPQPKMQLPNMWSLRQKFVRLGSVPSGRKTPRHACTFDLRNCFTSLQLPPEAWGTFRVQSPQGVCDLRTLPFGWKLSPPICQEVVGRHLREAFDLMPPPPPHLHDSFRPDRDHYLDYLLVVMENDPGWLRSCMQLVSAVLRGKGYQVSEKSVLEPATWVKWLGKEVDLDCLSISNTQAIVTRLIACLIVTWGRYVSKKDIMRIVGLVGWLGTPATGHLPFLGGSIVRSTGVGRTGSKSALDFGFPSYPQPWLSSRPSLCPVTWSLAGVWLSGFLWMQLYFSCHVVLRGIELAFMTRGQSADLSTLGQYPAGSRALRGMDAYQQGCQEKDPAGVYAARQPAGHMGHG